MRLAISLAKSTVKLGRAQVLGENASRGAQAILGAAAMSNPSIEPFEVRVYHEDTDFSGRVYHASYLRFLERGRTELLRRLGFANQEIAGRLGVIFVVRRLRIEYLAPAVMDDLLRVETEIAQLRGASMELFSTSVLWR
jgi:tol-pal system-associated acyl-CoA thioesterase